MIQIFYGVTCTHEALLGMAGVTPVLSAVILSNVELAAFYFVAMIQIFYGVTCTHEALLGMAGVTPVLSAVIMYH